ncbi:MAG: hypothetical protein NC310_02560, partial [Roseburia sp.]|nr:hypothetical protein [Roseburia sp.]
GAVISARSDRQAGFAAAVPSQWSGTVESTEIAVLENFWKRGTGDSAWREVVLKGWAGASTKRADLEALFGKSNEIYLTAYRNLLEVKNS